MKILVTGSAGFIGSTLVDRLLKENHSVIGVDNFSTGFIEFMESSKANSNFEFVKGDLLIPDLLDKHLKGVDAVFHMAANADIRGGLLNTRQDLEQNTIVTLNILESMRKSGVKKIIFASSAAALAEPSIFPTPEDISIPIQTSLYGASKMACEGLISSYCEGFNFEGYAFRFVSLLGPRYPHGHVFDFVQKLAINPKKLEILGNGMQKKSYLHIDDCINALIHICLKEKTAISAKHNFDIFHLGYPDFCLVKNSAKWICDELNLSPEFIFSGGDRGWVGDNPFVFLDVSKAMATGWKPQYEIEKSVRITARWLKDNSWIFKN